MAVFCRHHQEDGRIIGSIRLVKGCGVAGTQNLAHLELCVLPLQLIRKSVSPLIQPLVSPSNTIRSQQSSVRGDTSAAKKKPRTVHIDVYCTGSDAESGSDCGSCCSSHEDAKSLPSSGGSSASSCHSSVSSGSRFDTSHMMELKAAATAAAAAAAAHTQPNGDADPAQHHPTVYESEEMRVRHKRAGKHEMPRRLMQQTIGIKE